MHMKHRYATLFLTTFLLLLAPCAFAATGFVDSPLLLSPENPKDGDTVTLSVLFHNAEDTAITGTVLFYDNQTLIARDNLNIAPGDVGIADTSFVISPGIHKFSATMSDVNGGSDTLVISEATVTLPPAIVAKKLNLGAQASGEGGAQESVILQKVDSAEKAVLDAIPEGAKEAVSDTVSNIEEFREATGDTFVERRDEVKSGIEQGKKIDAENAELKPGKKPVIKPETADNGPAARIKYYFFALLAFFFSKPFAFYLGSVIIIYFVLRFIIRRIRAMRAR